MLVALRNRDALLLETDPREMETPLRRDARVLGGRSSRRYEGAMQAERDLHRILFFITVNQKKRWNCSVKRSGAVCGVGGTHGCGPGYPQSEPVIAFPCRISVAVLVFILPVAIKVQHEPEIVLAGRTAAVQQHERIHRNFVTIAERVGGCPHAQ